MRHEGRIRGQLSIQVHREGVLGRSPRVAPPPGPGLFKTLAGGGAARDLDSPHASLSSREDLDHRREADGDRRLLDVGRVLEVEVHLHLYFWGLDGDRNRPVGRQLREHAASGRVAGVGRAGVAVVTVRRLARWAFAQRAPLDGDDIRPSPVAHPHRLTQGQAYVGQPARPAGWTSGSARTRFPAGTRRPRGASGSARTRLSCLASRSYRTDWANVPRLPRGAGGSYGARHPVGYDDGLIRRRRLVPLGGRISTARQGRGDHRKHGHKTSYDEEKPSVFLHGKYRYFYTFHEEKQCSIA